MTESKGREVGASSGGSREDDSEPKRRIIQAALELFGEKGYDGTGVRQIASHAGVNLAMVNYYFGSKLNVLKAIFDEGSELIRASLSGRLDHADTLEEGVAIYVRTMVEALREHRGFLQVMLTHLHLDHHAEDFVAFKAERIRSALLPLMRRLLEIPPSSGKIRPLPPWFGSVIQGMLLFHFLITPMFRQVLGSELDDDFYEGFIEKITDFTLYGLIGQPPGDRSPAQT